MIKKAIKVNGMTCAMCAKTIENTFKNVDGASVKVNLGTGKVLATYDENTTDLVEIAQWIRKAGYEPVLEATLEENRESRKRMRREVWFASLLSLPLLWAMFGHLAWFSFLYVPELLMNGWFQLVVAGIVQFYIGKRFYLGAFRSIRKKVLGMDILVVLGTSAAYFYSVYLLIEQTMNPVMHPEYFFEISALIITMVLIGNYFEHIAKERSTDALVDLLNLGAKEARRRNGDTTEMVDIDQVVVGDELVVLANEKFPVDGEIIAGKTYVDEAMITGESVPVDKGIGDHVIGATINTQEKVVMRATKVGGDTMLSQIVSTVEEASSQKLPIQRTADTIASYFVPAVVIIALLNFLVHMVILDFAFQEAFTRSVAILVISCPCALGLATPTSILVGNGKAAQNHILYKGGEFFERANQINAIAFDKTGTLTMGKPVVTDTVGDTSVFSQAYALEVESTHPISKAFAAFAKENAQNHTVSEFETVHGKGIKARVDNANVVVGNQRLMESEGIDITAFEVDYTRLSDQAKTVNYIAINQEAKALYAVRDDVKPTSAVVIQAMRARGIETVMITGDQQRVANAIAKELGIDTVHASVLPNEKADLVKALMDDGKITAFVGDGINDAPALKTADVGIAMGHGTDIAIDSSDVTLMSHDLGLVVKAIDMSKATLKNIHQNFFWAFSYNFVAIPLAASGRLSMVLAAAAMAFSSIMVVLNALRLKWTKLPDFEAEIQKGGDIMTFKVTDMSCEHCEKAIGNALRQAGFDKVLIDLEAKTVTVDDAVDEADVKAVIEATGYTVA